MTTIAWDGVSLCSDSLMTCDGRRVGMMLKIHALHHDQAVADGFLHKTGMVGISGQVSAAGVVLRWLESGCRERPEGDLDFTALWIKRDGSSWCIEEDFNPYQISCPCAIGSGADIALAALTLGKTAREAVELAIKLDCISGGDIQELTL